MLKKIRRVLPASPGRPKFDHGLQIIDASVGTLMSLFSYSCPVPIAAGTISVKGRMFMMDNRVRPNVQAPLVLGKAFQG